jgi:hypothetical protein
LLTINKIKRRVMMLIDFKMIWMIRSNFGVDLGDDIAELLEVNGSVSVLIGEVDHLVDLSAGEVLSDAGSDLLELLGAESA